MSEKHQEHTERARGLMMAALDGELSCVEQSELDRMLATDENLRTEWDRLKTVKAMTDSMTFREPPEEVWDRYWVSVYNQAERGLGWLLFSVGLIAVFAWGAWHLADAMLADTQFPGWVKLAIFAVVLGGGILFLSVARERWFTRKHERYKEVQR